MKLYKDDGKGIYSAKYKEYIGSGYYGDVYRKIDSDECLKLFKIPGGRCDIDVLRFIKQKKLQNFYELREFLFNADKSFLGYTMKYYQDMGVDILTMPVEYTIENLRILYNSFMELTNNSIRVRDMHGDNAIVCKDKIVMVDADRLIFDYLNNYYLKEKNIEQLQYVFSDLYSDALYNYHTSLGTRENYEKIDRLFVFTSYCDSKRLDNTCKKLSYYKYPIDYIKEE